VHHTPEPPPSPGRTAVIVNPASGRGRGAAYARRLLAALAARGLRPRVWRTTGRGSAEELSRRALAEGFSAVVACGGDGTIHEAAQALANSEVALCPAPAGRCNDFARMLGRLYTPEEAARRLCQGRVRRVDLARAGGRVYCTVGAVGFDAEVSRYVDQARLWVRGRAAYLWGVARVLARYRPRPMRVRWEGGGHEGPLFLAAVANTPTYGNAIPIVPGARADDGLLDLCLVGPVSSARVMRVLPRVLRGRHLDLPEVSLVRTPWVEIDGRGLELWADGEPVGPSPLAIQALPRALAVVDGLGAPLPAALPPAAEAAPPRPAAGARRSG
jgi:diacylglycerol kinase (ATP)